MSVHCYQYNYNGASSSILLYFKFDWSLSGLSFSEVSRRAGTCQLVRGANHLTDSCMVHGFAGGCFRTDFHCITFHEYISLFSLNVAGLWKSSNVSFLSTHDADVFCGAQK